MRKPNQKTHRGGSRNPKGRNPLPPGEKKTAVTFYVSQSVVDLNGGMKVCRTLCANTLEQKAAAELNRKPISKP